MGWKGNGEINMEKLIAYLERALRRCDTYDSPKVAFSQAFGALEMFCELHPDLEEQAAELWNEKYKALFEQKIWGFFYG